MDRPAALTALAVLGFLYATILLVSGVIVLIGGTLSLTITRPLGTLGPITGLLLLLGAALDYLAAYGLFTLRRWGWLLSVVLLVLSIVFDAVRIAVGVGAVSSTLAIIASAMVLWYLLLPSTKAAFH